MRLLAPKSISISVVTVALAFIGGMVFMAHGHLPLPTQPLNARTTDVIAPAPDPAAPTDSTSHTAPTSAPSTIDASTATPVAPTPTPAPTSTPTSKTPTPTTVFQASSTDYPGGVVVLPDFAASSAPTISYSYQCTGDGKVFISYYSSPYVFVTSGAMDGPTFSNSFTLAEGSPNGHFTVRYYDASQTCSWQITVTVASAN